MDPIVHYRVIGDAREAKAELEAVGADPASHNIMAPKMRHLVVRVKDLDVPAANILKQEMLAKGAEAAVAKWASTYSQPRTDVLLMGTIKQYRLLLAKLAVQPHGLKKLIGPLERVLNSLDPRERSIECAGRRLVLGKRTLVMGILNVTPDSFSERGLYFDLDAAVSRAGQMVDEGADIIDIGGESTRPGAKAVEEAEELRRVIPVIRALAGIPVPISIDTSKAAVAEAAVAAGAAIVNDVTGLGGDPRMAAVCAETEAAVIVMHMRGSPRTMQENPEYEDLVAEILEAFAAGLDRAVAAGIDADKVMVDPGLGFGKTVEHNLEIIRRLREFKSLDRPLVLGPSRKSTIGRVLGNLPPEDRLEGTAATVAAAVMNGVDIVRVHDVRSMVRVARMIEAVKNGGEADG